MTQLERAKKGEITEEVRIVSADEGLDVEIVRRRVGSGKIVIPANKNRKNKLAGIGKGLSTKINASIGTSTDISDISMEIEKAKIAEEHGADTLMDLSVGGNVKEVRGAVM